MRLNRPFKQDTQMTIIKNITDNLSSKCNLKIIRPTFYKTPPDGKIIKQNPVYIYDYKNAVDIIDETKPDIILVMSSYELTGIAFSVAANKKNIPVVKIYEWKPDYYDDFDTKDLIKAKTLTAFSKNAFEDITGQKPKIFSNYIFMFKKFQFLFKTLIKCDYSFFDIFRLLFLFFNSVISKNDMKIQKKFQGDLNICATNDWISKLSEIGFQKSTLTFTGSCIFDKLYSKKRISKSNSKIKRILFCPSPMHGYGYWSKKKEDDLIINTVNEILKSNSYDLSIKLHPASHNIDEFKELSNNFLKKITIFQNEDLLELLLSYDAVITYGSSSLGLYSHIIQIPLIQIIHDGSDLKYNLFYNEKLSILCKEPKKIVSNIDELENFKPSENDYENFYKEFLGKFDGKSSERMAYAILKLLNYDTFNSSLNKA
jgi:UDP-N-acetylglucosamine 2-epimerase